MTPRHASIWGAVTCLLAACGPGAPGDTASASSSGSGSAASSDATAPPSTGGPGPTAASASEPAVTDTDPGPDTAPTTTATSSADTGPSHDDTSDTDIPPQPGVPLDQFTCADARWRFVEPTLSSPANARVDSRGHLRLTSHWALLEFDETGALVGHIEVPPPWGWGGIDAADNFYVSFLDERLARKGLRKLAVTGESLWQIDRGPAQANDFSGRVTVAPDGTTLIAGRNDTRAERYDPAGVLVWDKTLADKRFDDPFAMNTAGVAAAIRYGVDGAVLALAPDASVLWERPFGSRGRAFADIDEGGVVVAASLSWPPHVIRLASDGAVLWDKTIELPMLADGHVSAVATNEVGAIALAIGATLHDTQVALALRLGPDGEVTALHACDPTSDGQGIALDEAGTIYLAGVVWAEDGEHLFAVALE